jgi:DNA-directed RNA polymerase specialized sigma24 family protein
MTQDEYGQAYQRGIELTRRFLLSRGARPECALEASQAAWAKGWERLHQLRQESLVVTWVNTIALNMHRRLNRWDSFSELDPSLATGTDSVFLTIEAGRVLEMCSPKERFLLEQQMYGNTTSEMANRLGVTETAVRIRLLRARRSVRVRLERRAAHLRKTSSEKQVIADQAA